MTRSELITKWCAAEGGKKSALDAPQAREVYAKLRAIIGETEGIDLDDVINGRGKYEASDRLSYKQYSWKNGKPVK